MIIIEGIDKTGKSTICKKLESEFPFLHCFRISRPAKDSRFSMHQTQYWKEFSLIQKAEIELITKLREEGQLRNLILDRFHASEYAYLEEGEEKDLNYIWDIDRRLGEISPPPIIILLHAPVEWIEDRLGEDELKMFSPKHVKRYSERFHEFGRNTKIPQLQLVSSFYNIDELYYQVSKFVIKSMPYLFKEAAHK